jgi:hypothetical protein
VRAAAITGMCAAAGAASIGEPVDPMCAEEVAVVCAARGAAALTAVGSSASAAVGGGANSAPDPAAVRGVCTAASAGDETCFPGAPGFAESERSTRGAAADAADPPPRRGRRLPAAGGLSSTDASDASDDPGAVDPRRGASAREPRRIDGAAVLGESAVAVEESEFPLPVDPLEPVVSAKAAGIAKIAEPTPNTTARAPTRPT